MLRLMRSAVSFDHQQAHRGAVEMLQQLPVLGPGQNGIGVERFLDGQALVIIEGFRALGRCGRNPEVIPLSPYVEGLVRKAGLVQHRG
jgi:hypothetical protein